MSSELEYHLGELEVARSQSDPRRAMPAIPEGCARILDVGCGAGQTLLASDLKGAQAFGVDYEHQPLRLGKQMAGQIEFVRASGEYLPFARASFDFAMSRVALPYMRVAVAVAEIARVLKPGGSIWFTLHPMGMFSRRVRFGGLKQTLFEMYRLGNTALLHIGASQVRYPLNRARIESYQTERGMRRLLDRCGFESISVSRGAHFVISARKRPSI
jgi:ubiquinone/menaquinone biosynthesis C-methylase UbiE